MYPPLLVTENSKANIYQLYGLWKVPPLKKLKKMVPFMHRLVLVSFFLLLPRLPVFFWSRICVNEGTPQKKHVKNTKTKVNKLQKKQVINTKAKVNTLQKVPQLDHVVLLSIVYI